MSAGPGSITVVAVRGLVAFAGLVALQSKAQDALAQQVLARCAQVADKDERLACYDAAAQWIEAVEPNGKAPPKTTETPSEAPQPAPAAGSFGLEPGGGAVGEITSRIVGAFTGWHGNTRFTLENGQVWQQNEPGRAIYRAKAPRVKIHRGAMGTFLMEIEGVRRSLRVRRVE